MNFTKGFKPRFWWDLSPIKHILQTRSSQILSPSVGWSKHINYNGDLTGYTYIYIYICRIYIYVYIYIICSPSPAFFLAPFPFLEGTCVLAKSTLCTATSSSFSRLNCLPVATCYFHNPGCFFISHWSVHWYHHEELGKKLNIYSEYNGIHSQQHDLWVCENRVYGIPHTMVTWIGNMTINHQLLGYTIY